MIQAILNLRKTVKVDLGDLGRTGCTLKVESDGDNSVKSLPTALPKLDTILEKSTLGCTVQPVRIKSCRLGSPSLVGVTL